MARFALFALVSATLAACGGSSGATNDPCTGSETRCDGDKFQTCNGEVFETSETCAGSTVCDPTIGCASCTPVNGTFCDGDNVVTCDGDGNTGSVVETCDPGECSGGSCGGGFCGAAGVDLIYVVDQNSQFFSFDPEKLGGAADPFTLVGTLSCPAGQSLRLGEGAGTPFSMSVDRNGIAWVLYTSGEIFHVSIDDASCQATSFQVGQNGFELFGMGFVSDSAGSDAETLFVTGGAADVSTPGQLGSIDTGSMALSPIGMLPNAEFGPELTGTGDAKLFGYYPGASTTFVAEMDKASGSTVQNFPLTATGGLPAAWAFAHYGGKFYIFITDGSIIGGMTSRVVELDPAGPTETTVIPNSAHTIVGAGVSTCAPVVVD